MDLNTGAPSNSSLITTQAAEPSPSLDAAAVESSPPLDAAASVFSPPLDAAASVFSPPLDAVANLTDSTTSMVASNSTPVSTDPLPLPLDSNTTPVESALWPSLMDSNATLVLSDPSILSLTSAESRVTSEALPTQSATPQMSNSNTTGSPSWSLDQWKKPTIAIGIGCLVLGFTCVIVGTILYIRAKQQARRRSTRRLNVTSGFDFRDGAEDDYDCSAWNKSQLAGTNEKSGFDMHSPITQYQHFRNSATSTYSKHDIDDAAHESNDHHSHDPDAKDPHIRVVTGFAH